MNRNYLFLFIGCLSLSTCFPQKSNLSVEKIMRDPSWMGSFPSEISWGAHSENIYFQYNPEGNPEDSLYRINVNTPREILKVTYEEEKKLLPNRGDYNKKRNKKVYTKDAALFIYDLNKREEKRLLELNNPISEPQFLLDENQISFVTDQNVFIYLLDSGQLRKLTNIKTGKEEDADKKELSAEDQWLKDENFNLLEEVREREEKKSRTKRQQEQRKPKPFTWYSGTKNISDIHVSPRANYVSLKLLTPSPEKDTKVPDYTDATGYTTNLPARAKVGNRSSQVELAIYNVKKDTVYYINTEDLPGLEDQPDYIKDYPDREWKKEKRQVIPSRAIFSENGEKAIVNLRSLDNKDRWIALLDLETGKLTSVERQRDEAWLAGPGIGYTWGGENLGWMPDNETIYFQSEETGYSHLYTLNTTTGKKEQLTSGKFEIFEAFISKDVKNWFLTTSENHPGERHFYKMPLKGGKMQKLTSMEGNNEVFLSPDEKYMAIRHSYKNKPWELYLKKTSPTAEALQLTEGQTEEFKAYDWREPEIIHFEARDGAMVPARLFKPSEKSANGAAVVFVHGAGYLQNAHKWWSSYFREYMFHNLLTDLGYTILDIDYRGSAGYGRDWRTGIYRHMGGKDLSDQVDGVNYLISEHNIDPERVGIYGGSYGGFITLMAMFTQPEVFEAGAALRSVTDWAHYNHGYTSNILNEPVLDPLAYRRSSPIYFAEGLEGHLLIAHGMTDVNVHFQDVVRLAQRLIELKKENWELAVYPVEDHGFVEPSSWTDEYRRILKLFNETLLKEE